MSEKESAGALDQIVRAAFGSARAQVAVLGSGARLALAELKLVGCRAGLAVGILIVVAGAVLVGWVMLLILGALLLHAQGLSAVKATLIVLLFHTCGLIGLLIFLRQTVKAITLAHTRRALQGSPDSPASATDEALENQRVQN